ncbi:MAG: hypothetical protein IAI49_01980, partial [Candidatus Eremiobacteraeota bacterium]|nr:hypothetical protein [Candidatus Eremiobacteraeota bacterium]
AAEGTVALADADVAVVRTDDRAALARWAEAARAHARLPPIWVVYVKGRSAPLGESAVREEMRRFGFVDTKIAAVSERLTALCFVKRAGPAREG